MDRAQKFKFQQHSFKKKMRLLYKIKIVFEQEN